MKNYVFSPLLNSFYPIALKADYQNAGTWPADGIIINDELFNEFTGIPPDGKERGVGEDGKPVWQEVAPLSHDEQVELANLNTLALLAAAKEKISLWQTELQLGIISDDDKASLIAWMKYIQSLNAVDTSTAPDIEWPVKPE